MDLSFDDYTEELADSIIEANVKGGSEGEMLNGLPVLETDEFGYKRTEKNKAMFLVARTLALDEKRKQKIVDAGGREPLGLYNSNGAILIDNRALRFNENAEEIMRLAGWFGPIKRYEGVEYWELMRKLLPKLNGRFMAMAQNTYWDYEQHKIVDVDEVRKILSDETAE